MLFYHLFAYLIRRDCHAQEHAYDQVRTGKPGPSMFMDILDKYECFSRLRTNIGYSSAIRR